MDGYELFINKLRDLRKARGMNQGQLAELAGISKVMLARYETLEIQSGMPLVVAMRLANALGTKLEYMLAGELSTERMKLHGLIDQAPEKDLKVLNDIMQPIVESRIQKAGK
jgi:transcriptional regulator with XRE-family HTH domain